MTGSWTSLVSVTWAALGSRGVTVGRWRVEMRQCVTGVVGQVVADSGGRKTLPPLVEMILEKSGWMLGGSDSSGGVGPVIATLTRFAMTISMAMSCSWMRRGGWWSSPIASEDIESSGDSVVVLEYDPLAMALATSLLVDESQEGMGVVMWGVGR